MPKPKTPTKILDWKGSYKKDPQRKRKGEPMPTGKIGKPPVWLSKDAAKAWRYLVRKCHPGVLTSMDGPGMVAMAVAFAPLMDKDKTLGVVEIKGISIMLGKFGFTPSDRAGIVSDAPDDKGGWAGLD